MREASGNMQTLVLEGTELQGDLKARCPIVVAGEIQGNVEAPQVTLQQGAVLTGNVKARKFRSFGTLSGQVESEEAVVFGAVTPQTVIKTQRLELLLETEDAPVTVCFLRCVLDQAGESAAGAAKEPFARAVDLPQRAPVAP